MTRSIGEKLRSYKRTPGSFILMLLVMLSAIITFAVLLFLIAYILINGIPHIKPELFALKYTSENGSLFPALINTIIMTALSLIIAVPFGIFSAIFLVEYAKRGNKFINVIRITTETLSGIPSIVYGLLECCFCYNIKMGVLFAGGSVYIVDHDSSAHYAYYRRGVKSSSRQLSGRKFWTWSG